MSNDSSQEIKSLAFGVRTIVLFFTLVLSFINIGLALQINIFQTIFSDMLGSKPLPLVTEFLIYSKPLWIGLSVLFVIAASLVIIFVRSHKWSLISVAGIMVAICLQTTLTWIGLLVPLMSILAELSSGN